MTEAPRIFLDLDGTLVDPAEGIIGSIRYASAEVGADVPETDMLTCSLEHSGEGPAVAVGGRRQRCAAGRMRHPVERVPLATTLQAR